MIKDGNMAIMTGQIDFHNLYHINISNNALISIPHIYAITAATYFSPTNLVI